MPEEDALSPDFSKEELVKAIEQYNKRDRRFGKAAKVKEKV